MELEKLKYERNVLMIGLKQWDDLLTVKQRETHTARNRLLAEIQWYEQMIAEQESTPLRRAA